MTVETEATALPTYQLTTSDTTVIRFNAGGTQTSIPVVDANPDYQQYLRDVEAGATVLPPAPPPLDYASTTTVDAGVTTTDANDTEIFRFAVPQKRIYQGNLVLSGADRANFVSRQMEGRFAWKRTTGNAIMVGITVVSSLGEAASSAWAPNALPQGTDIVFTVKGAAGRTIDWRLSGVILGIAPEGSTEGL